MRVKPISHETVLRQGSKILKMMQKYRTDLETARLAVHPEYERIDQAILVFIGFVDAKEIIQKKMGET